MKILEYEIINIGGWISEPRYRFKCCGMVTNQFDRNSKHKPGCTWAAEALEADKLEASRNYNELAMKATDDAWEKNR